MFVDMRASATYKYCYSATTCGPRSWKIHQYSSFFKYWLCENTWTQESPQSIAQFNQPIVRLGCANRSHLSWKSSHLSHNGSNNTVLSWSCCKRYFNGSANWRSWFWLGIHPLTSWLHKILPVMTCITSYHFNSLIWGIFLYGSTIKI